MQLILKSCAFLLELANYGLHQCFWHEAILSLAIWSQNDECFEQDIQRAQDYYHNVAGRCDAFISNYDAKGRDLLIEAKPDPDRGALRIAIGQLLDYRRYVPHRAATDLAVLTISRPETSYTDLLVDVGITAMWFQDEQCKRIKEGHGKAWKEVSAAMKA